MYNSNQPPDIFEDPSSKYNLLGDLEAAILDTLSLLLLFASPVKANVVSSPSASSSGTVINNGYQTINGGFPFLSSGILVNNKSMVVGTLTNGPEIMMLTRAFTN